ncbi:MAG: alpha amylase N-terminal ig-like domain-containing protein [Phycisphaerae bacterium]
MIVKRSLVRKAAVAAVAAFFGVSALAVSLGLPPFTPAPAAAEVVQDGRGITFKLDTSTWTDRPTSVNLAGSFNGWNNGATPMTDDNGDNVWEVTLTDIPMGRHQYKFVVNGDVWMTDPTDDRSLRVGDNYGGENSGFIAGPDIRKAEPPKPNDIKPDFVRHDPMMDLTAIDTGLMRARVRVQADDAQRAELLVMPAGDLSAMTATRMEHAGTDGGYDVFEATVQLPPGMQAAEYAFRLIDGDHTYVTQDRLLEVPAFDIPEWTHHAQWYQIFPERFRNGNPDNDPGAFEYENLIPWEADWWETHADAGEVAGEGNFYQGAGNVWNRRYGGDIQGVKEALPYLRSLGVTAIYFNPVFEGESMHKYDTADFRHIDDNFGIRSNVRGDRYEIYPPTPNRLSTNPDEWGWTESDKVFLDFLAEAKRQGFKVIVDGVFNHVGRAHPYFIDVLEKGPESEFADWFEITDWGDPANHRPMADPFAVHGKPGGIQWRAWDQANGHLPVFRKDAEKGLAEGPYNHIMAITKRWLDPDGDPSTDDGIDGWRLDVPGDIPHPFWRDWRKVVKETKPDAYITGEIWNWAQPWLQGDQFDAVMNYQFAMTAQDFFVDREIEPSELDSRVNQLLTAYPRPITYAQQNLFDSHDTDRLASMFVNPGRPYDGANRPQDNAANFDPPYSDRKPTEEEWTRMLQAITFQQTFVGAPMTYYGNEVGMWSPDDPSNRQPMVWMDKLPYEDERITFNHRVFDHFQRTKATRAAFEALRVGEFETILVDDERDVYGFVRKHDDQEVYVVVNRSANPVTVQVPVTYGGALFDYLDESQVELVPMDIHEPTSRPTVRVFEGVEGLLAQDGVVTVELEAWDSAVLAPAR